MTGIGMVKSTSPGVVIPFFAGGALAFVVLCLLLFLSPESLTTHYFNPHLLSIVHTAALGGGTMIIFGASYQLLPVVFERDLFSPSIAVLSWYTLTAGAALLVFSFRDFHTGWIMTGGGALIVLSALAYTVNVVFTACPLKRYSAEGLFIVTASVWLLVTVGIGLLLAINLSYPFFSKNHLEILKLHAHAGLGGWFLQLVAGVSIRLVPMFLLGKSSKDKLLLRAFILINTGLILFLADGYFYGVSGGRILLYAALTGTGVAGWLVYLCDVYRNRARKRIDIQMKHTAVSLFCLVPALLTIPLVAFTAGYRWTVLYGALLFMGWITGVILAKTFKTLPFIVWNMRYKDLTGKTAVPSPGDLVSQSLLLWQYRLFVTGVLSLAAGVLLNEIMVIRLSSAVWLLLSLLYAGNVLRILLHKTGKIP